MCGLALCLLLSKSPKITEIRGLLLLYYIYYAHFPLFFHPHKIKNTKFQNSSITLTVQVIILPPSSILQSCKEINAQIFFTMGFLNFIPMFLPSYLPPLLLFYSPFSIYFFKSEVAVCMLLFCHIYELKFVLF